MEERLSQYRTSDKSITCVRKWKVADIHCIERIVMDNVRVQKIVENFYIYNEDKNHGRY